MTIKPFTLFLGSLSYLALAGITPVNAQVSNTYNCARMPLFISKVGLQQPVAIDTKRLDLPGVTIKELSAKKRSYRHQTWRITGHVSSTVRDGLGNIYVVPVPSISLDINPIERNNVVYKIASETGLMEKFVQLPKPSNLDQSNPFGTMSISLDCSTNSLYVASVAGSTPAQVNGRVYQIDIKTKQIISKSAPIDAVGVAVADTPSGKRLYYGDARSSSLYSIALNQDGSFDRSQQKRYELSLLHVKNGDSTQIRKINFFNDQAGKLWMRLSDTEFSFRLAAETNRQYKNYDFAVPFDLKSWADPVISNQ